MSKLRRPESCSYTKSWLPLESTEPEIHTLAGKAWEAEQLKKHKLECKRGVEMQGSSDLGRRIASAGSLRLAGDAAEVGTPA